MKNVRIVVTALVLAGLGAIAAAQDDVPVASMRFLVLRDSNGKPVHNAAVILHPVNAKGKQSRGGIELKTDTEGRTGFDGVPYGMLRVQVLAQGLQTFGQDYDVNKPEMEVIVKLKRPQKQFSIYDQPGSKPPEKKSDQQDTKKPPEQKPQ